MTLQEFTAAGTEVIVSAENPAREASRSRGLHKYLLILLSAYFTSRRLTSLRLTSPTTPYEYPIYKLFFLRRFCSITIHKT